jgi:hypothetical protein
MQLKRTCKSNRERHRQSKFIVAFGRTDGGHNTSNPEETMGRTIQCSHLDAHGLDSQLLDWIGESSDDKVLLAP